MHPRLTVNERAFHEANTLADDLHAFERAGVERVGLSWSKVDIAGGAPAARRDALAVTHVALGPLVRIGDPDAVEADRALLRRAVEHTAQLGASLLYGTTGAAPELPWDDAAARFANVLEPIVEYADSLGVAILTEATQLLNADISMVFSLPDSVELARRAGIGVCLDLQHCWGERTLRKSIQDATDEVQLVQFSDFVPQRKIRHWPRGVPGPKGGTFPYRGVPGDGVIPLERLLGWVLESGYNGRFDLELAPEDGVDGAERLKRAVQIASELLTRLDA